MFLKSQNKGGVDMKHLENIERFTSLVEKVKDLYGMDAFQAHEYVINFLKENNKLDKEELVRSKGRR